jgi:hypothetical protein
VEVSEMDIESHYHDDEHKDPPSTGDRRACVSLEK